ncbi:MAG: hypothetical protein PHQ43_11355 [Dehalococcoidales bacterium]|nr:hypothetical protein [Dehalococcoidales bacterium]
MISRILRLSVVLMLLVGLVGCGKGSGDVLAGGGVGGTYVNEDNSREYLELDSDGTFYCRESGIGISGSWEVEGDTLALIVTGGMEFYAKIRGDRLEDEEGKVWVKTKQASRSLGHQSTRGD